MITNAWLTAVYRAMNKTMQKAKTNATKKIREKYNIKLKDLNPRIKKYSASRNRLTAGFFISEKQGLKFLFFKPTVSEKEGVKIVFRKDRAPQEFKHAFLAKMPSGHINIFERIGKSSDKYLPTKGRYKGKGIGRQKIKSLYSLDVADMFNYFGTKEIEKIIKKEYPDLFAAQLHYEWINTSKMLNAYYY